MYEWLIIKLKEIFHILEADENEIFYIGGNDVLPPPLDASEEKDLLIEFENGSQDARSILIERNLRLVVYIAKKFESAGINRRFDFNRCDRAYKSNQYF